MKRLVLHTLILLTIAQVISAQPARNRHDHVGATREKVLILFDEEVRHIDLILTTRTRIQRSGGHVRAVMGLAGILADVAPGSVDEIAATEGVHVYNSTIAMPLPADAETAAVVAAWNRIREPVADAKSSGGPPLHVLSNDVREDPNRPRDRFQIQALADAYRLHAQELRRTLPPRLQRSSGIGCGSNGADYTDTSLYFAGDIAVGVFYVQSDNPWTPALTTSTFADVVNALDAFVDMEPGARLTFTYSNEVDGVGNALPKPSNEYLYVNDLRSTYCTDWAFLIDMSNGGVWPNTYLHGPSLRMELTFGWFSDVLRHEVGHIFGAGDAYAPHSPDDRYGYLMGAHANACGQGGAYFNGEGECIDDLMAGWGSTYGYNSHISPSTASQLGWLASRGDGVLDVLDTKPVIDGSTVVHVVNAATSAVTYHGVAIDRPLLNEIPYLGSVSINRITAVQYRLDYFPWQEASPADGVFDSNSEEFNFTTPPLPNGTYTVEIQAINTIDAVTPILYSEQLVITGSSVSNTRPFARLTITPDRAMSGTTISASGAGSRDLEPGPLEYSWNWGSSWTPFAPTPMATHVYTAPGIYAVQLRVRDQGGLFHLVSHTVTITAADTPPIARLHVTPESQYDTGLNYSVYLSAAGSHDAETPFSQLKVQWDIDCDGLWDGPPSTLKAKLVTFTNANYPRSDRRCVRMQVIDGALNTTAVKQYVWVVPYDHTPVISSVTFAPSGPDFYILTVNASDPDQLTPWDGILEYRYDFDGDGIWDTTYQPGPGILVPAENRDTVIVEVRDRFNARALWYWIVPCWPLAC